jgi:hypothetical protein
MPATPATTMCVEPSADPALIVGLLVALVVVPLAVALTVVEDPWEPVPMADEVELLPSVMVVVPTRCKVMVLYSVCVLVHVVVLLGSATTATMGRRRAVASFAICMVLMFFVMMVSCGNPR